MAGTAALKNTMLDNWGVTQLSLHTAYSTTGANEVAGGSPAYARQNVTYAAASSGSKALTTQPVFNVPASTIPWIGKWTGSTFAGMTANGGQEKEFHVDVSANTVTCYGHAYSNGQTIAFYGDTPPGGLSEGTIYYVVSATTDTFQVSATLGGAAIDITAVPATGCVVSKIVAQVFSDQATMTINTGSSNLNG